MSDPYEPSAQAFAAQHLKPNLNSDESAVDRHGQFF